VVVQSCEPTPEAQQRDVWDDVGFMDGHARLLQHGWHSTDPVPIGLIGHYQK
jgi:hypothetical protein